MSIYTKTGDKGETSLFGGKRISKADPIVEAYGEVDELNSWVGLLIAEITQPEKKDFLLKIQADLHLIEGRLSGWKADLSPLITRVTEMEVEIDAMDDQLPPLENFILPGGTSLAAHTHIARTMTRNVERRLVKFFAESDSEEQIILQYFNRLSDLFFVLARFINMNAGIADTLWIGIPRKVKK